MIDLILRNETIDLAGRLITPPLVEPHIHLDAVLTVGQARPNVSGSLFEGIAIWAERAADLSYEELLIWLAVPVAKRNELGSARLHGCDLRPVGTFTRSTPSLGPMGEADRTSSKRPQSACRLPGYRRTWRGAAT